PNVQRHAHTGRLRAARALARILHVARVPVRAGAPLRARFAPRLEAGARERALGASWCASGCRAVDCDEEERRTAALSGSSLVARPRYQSHIDPSSSRAIGNCFGTYGYFAASFSSMSTP